MTEKNTKYFGHVATTADGNIRVELGAGCFIKRSGDMKYLVAPPRELDGLYEILRASQLEPLAAPLPGENLAHVLDAAENSLYRAKQLRGHAQAMEEDGAKAWAARLRKAADELDRRTRYAVMEALGPDAVGVESTSTFDDEAPRHTMRGVSLYQDSTYEEEGLPQLPETPAVNEQVPFDRSPATDRIKVQFVRGRVTVLLDGEPVGNPYNSPADGWCLMIDSMYATSYGRHGKFEDLLAEVQRVGHLEHTPPSIPVKPEWGDGAETTPEDTCSYWTPTTHVYCNGASLLGSVVRMDGRWRCFDADGGPLMGPDSVAEYDALEEAKLAVQRAVGFATHAEAEAGAEPDADKTPGVDAPVFATTADDFYGRSPEAMRARIAELEAQVAACSNILAERFAPVEITRFDGNDLVGTAYVGLPVQGDDPDSERPWRFDAGPAYRGLREKTIRVPYASLENLFTHVATCTGVEKHALTLDNGRGEDSLEDHVTEEAKTE